MELHSAFIAIIVAALIFLVKPPSSMAIPPYASTGAFGAGIRLGAVIGGRPHITNWHHASTRTAKAHAQ